MFKHYLSIVIFFLMVVPCHAAMMTGKATVQSDPVAGITVSAYPIEVMSFTEAVPYNSSPTRVDGQFELEVPPGQYYVIARGEGLFTYYGRNPLSVPEEGVQKVNMLMLPTSGETPQANPLVETGVLGTVTWNGKPVAGASASIYPDLSSQLKGFGMGMSAPSDENGFFEVPLEPGTYYLVVRQRKSGAFAGPLRAGDLFGYYPGNAIALKQGEVARVEIPLIEVPQKVERFASSLFGNTAISGTIVDKDGNPLAGLRALLYKDEMMLNRPEYVSQPTGPDGEFIISFPKGGTYYLAARNVLGGTPAPGELYGKYAGTRDGSIFVKTGKNLKKIVITVEEVW
ncbi:MAG: hypothetical protein C0623_07970 [Desulfuromonas sp.]|nr:MAG: hypothetical protein C0623_07970 [Desulfuromonas sp.]